MRYRPELDGLRAIAVLLVLVFHINDKWMPGGFIGVDVFFVLSGFLITSNIFHQIETNNFKFSEFYKKRVKRLLPSLYLILIVFTLFAYLLYLPADIQSLNSSLKKIVFFAANYHFMRGFDYFAPAVNETLFLHTWSLAIEEQFYFIWPLFMFILYKRKLKMKTRYAIAFLLVLASVIYAEFLVRNNQTLLAYYSFLSRFGELMFGGILAASRIKIEKFSLSLDILGMLGVVLSAFLLSKASLFPGVSCVPAVLGTGIILISGDSVIKKILSMSFFVFIGTISYQIYLWHWPLLAISRYMTSSYFLSNLTVMIIILLTVVFSYLSWKYIERPIRYNTWTFKQTVMRIYILPTIIIFTLIGVSPYFYPKKSFFDKEIFSSYGHNICHSKLDEKICLKGDLTKSPKILVIGDSHAAHLNSFFDEIGKKIGKSFFIVTASSCPPLDGYVPLDTMTEVERANCNKAISYVNAQWDNYDAIVIAGMWDYYLGYDELKYYGKDILEVLKSNIEKYNSKKIFIVSQIPKLAKNIKRAELLKNRYNLSSFEINSTKSDTADIANKNINVGLTNNLEKKYTYIDLYSVFIETSKTGWFKDQPLYFDKHHMNEYAGRVLAEKILFCLNKSKPDCPFFLKELYDF